MNFLDADSSVEYYNRMELTMAQFKFLGFLEMKVWKPFIVCGNYGYYIKDILFKVLFRQDLDDCYKTLIDNLQDPSTLWTGWLIDHCDFGKRIDVTFFEYEPIPDGIADRNNYLWNDNGIDKTSDNCIDVKTLLSKRYHPLLEAAFDWVVAE